MKSISIIVPCFNEEGNIEQLCKRITEITTQLPQYSWNTLFVDDGSSDHTIDKIKADVVENLGEYYAEIFFTYMTLKSTQSISYKKLAAEKGISTRRVSQIIGMVKEYIRNNPTLQSYKNVLNKED